MPNLEGVFGANLGPKWRLAGNFLRNQTTVEHGLGWNESIPGFMALQKGSRILARMSTNKPKFERFAGLITGARLDLVVI